MDVSRETHDVTTKPKCYDLTNIQVCTSVTYVRAYARTCVHIYIYIYISLSLYIYIYIYIYIYERASAEEKLCARLRPCPLQMGPNGNLGPSLLAAQTSTSISQASILIPCPPLHHAALIYILLWFNTKLDNIE